MKILGFNIGGKAEVDDVQNVTRKINERLKIVEKVIQRDFSRTSQDVSKWRRQTIIAESVHNPLRAGLYNIYRDVVLDPHLCALMSTLEMKLKAGELKLYNSQGECDEEETAKLKEEWFFQYVKYFLEAKFWGHSLVQIEEVKNDKFVLSLVDRMHVAPETGMVKTEPYAYATSGTPYRERPYSDWLIEIGETHDLGILHKATPLALWKKGVMGAWSHYAEIFGMPIRIGKTAVNNPTYKANMDAMLSEMAQASWATIGLDDEIQLIQANSTDAYQVYKEMLNTVNQEMSKLVLTQTGTTDEKSFVGSSEVHERQLNELVTGYKRELLFNFKKQVLPKMERLGMVKSGLVAKWDNSEKQTLQEQFEKVEKLLPYYSISPEWIEETFSIPTEEKTTFQNTESVMNRIKNLYNPE